MNKIDTNNDMIGTREWDGCMTYVSPQGFDYSNLDLINSIPQYQMGLKDLIIDYFHVGSNCCEELMKLGPNKKCGNDNVIGLSLWTHKLIYKFKIW